jgi:multidrug efflux pump subunit AcrB
VTFYLQATQPLTVQEIHDDSVKLVEYLEKNYPSVKRASQFYEVDTPELRVDVDAEKAYYYGVDFKSAYNSLQGVFGLYYINFFTKWADLFWVEITGDYDYRKNPELLNTVYIKNNQDEMVPAGNIMKLTETTGAEVVTRLNDFLASQIVVDPDDANGHTSGEIMDIIEEAVPKVLGNRYDIKWFGLAYQQQIAGNQSAIALSLGLIMVFLILAALFELWTLPIAIVMALPFALFGAAFVLLIFQKPNDLYFQVSLLTLIGLSAKNAILIVEFAIDGVRKEAMSYRDAAIHAARLRFRPIVMTSIAFILGAVPLVTANGAGAHAQNSVGAGIVGGMLGSTCVAVLFVPMFFTVMMKFSRQVPKPEK